MKKAKIYRPNKSAMQSGLGKSDKWILEFETKDPTKSFNGLGEFIRHIYRTKLTFSLKNLQSIM